MVYITIFQRFKGWKSSEANWITTVGLITKISRGRSTVFQITQFGALNLFSVSLQLNEKYKSTRRCLVNRHGFTIVIFIHYKPRIAVAILDL